MVTRSPKALLVGIHHWNSHIQVGTHYIGRYLSEIGFEVAFISAPVTPLHIFKAPSAELRQRKSNSQSRGDRTGFGLWHYVPRALLAPDNRPLLSSSWVLNHWQSLSYPNIASVVTDAGFAEVDLLFLDSIYQPFWLDDLSYRLSAYRLADNVSGFKGHSAAMREVESQIIKRVDRVFAASPGLKELAEGQGAKSMAHLPNGIDLTRFSGLSATLDDRIAELKGPVAVYVGAFENWFDHGAIRALATARPDVNILLIGPTGPWCAKYKAYPNVCILGSVSAEKIPAYLKLADVGLIPFDVARFPTLINDVNPLKLYEYLAAGLPVVSYRWKEIERLNSPATLVEDTDEFVAAVSAALKQSDRATENREFARQFEWAKTLSPLGNWLKQSLPGVLC